MDDGHGMDENEIVNKALVVPDDNSNYIVGSGNGASLITTQGYWWTECTTGCYDPDNPLCLNGQKRKYLWLQLQHQQKAFSMDNLLVNE